MILFITGLIPKSTTRKHIRKRYLIGQKCPKNNIFYLVTKSTKKKRKFINNGLKIEIYGINNIIEIDESASYHEAYLIIRGNNNKFYIGKNVTACNAKFFLYGNDCSIEIGDDCMFSYDVEIWSGDGHAIFNDNNNRPINGGENVVIGKHVWLGAHTRILKGSKVGDGCIIGMSSLVNKKFDRNNCILAGNPARIIKQNMIWERPSPEYYLEKNN